MTWSKSFAHFIETNQKISPSKTAICTKKSLGQKIYPLLKFNLIIVLKVRTIRIHIFDLKRKQAIDDALALQFIGKVSKSLNFMGATLW